MLSIQCTTENISCPKNVIRLQSYLINGYIPGSYLKKKKNSSGLDVDFSSVSSARKAFPGLKAHVSQSPTCLLPTHPPDLTFAQVTCIHYRKWAMPPAFLCWLESIEAGRALGLEEKNEGQQNSFWAESLCFTELGKSAVFSLTWWEEQNL